MARQVPVVLGDLDAQLLALVVEHGLGVACLELGYGVAADGRKQSSDS